MDVQPMAELPAWLQDIALAGFAVAPLITVIVQIIKVVGARLGLPEGYSAWIDIAVSAIVLAVVISANVFDIEPEIASVLDVVQRVGEVMLLVLASIGWYGAAKLTKAFRPVNWQ